MHSTFSFVFLATKLCQVSTRLNFFSGIEKCLYLNYSGVKAEQIIQVQQIP